MGASASIEVSFIDNKTGELMSSEKIQALTQDAKEAIDKFDFSNSFYDIYKNPDTYKKLAEEWNKNHQNIKVNV
jgi:hypothetical protein